MLQELALWADVLGGLAVIGGVIFGAVHACHPTDSPP